VVIICDGPLASIERISLTQPDIEAGAGVPLHTLVDFCTEKGLAGVEFLAGIPGTVGGAVVMNAGSWGEQMQGVIREITVLTSRGVAEKRDSSGMSFTYRGLDLESGDIILKALLNLRFDKPASIRKRVNANRKQRRKNFPLDMPSAGSIFKNPEGNHAGRLIDAVGLKGAKRGGAMISPKHANFIVNTGQASAADILELMDLAAVKVKEVFNKQLVPEIKVAGKK
jgi:UDP-N-acetylmuramate dehydrogenase